MFDLSAEATLGLFGALAAAVAGVELGLRGRRANRWREYSVVVLGGVVGAGIGVLIDLVTSSISPEYFVLGKGLEDGPGLQREILRLGMHAGFCAGVVSTGALLIAAGRSSLARPGSLARCVRASLSVAVSSLIGASSLGLLSWMGLSTVVSIDDPRFTLVWMIHLGAYAGFLLQTFVVIRRARRWRVSVEGNPL